MDDCAIVRNCTKAIIFSLFADLTVSSEEDEIDYEPKPKKKKMATPRSNPVAGTSASANRDVENIAPSQQLIRLEKKLQVFLKDITKAFPWTKFGSDRDAFCYKRVRGHLQVFKRECLEQCKVFIDSKQWKDAIDYIIIAWAYVDQMPRWDDTKHNKVNEQCYKKLATYLANSLKKGTFQKQEMQNYIDKYGLSLNKIRNCFYQLVDFRFKELTEGSENDSDSDDVKDNGMQNSIKVAETILKKMK